MTRQNENYNRYLLSDWRPENPAFWENKGKGIARRNLWISVSCLLLAFCVWMLFSAVAVNLNKIGFNFTTDQLFLLTALPSLSGAILRVPYSFMVPLFGGRKWTVKHRNIDYSLRLAGIRRAKSRHPFRGIYAHRSVVRFCGGKLRVQYGQHQLFLSKSQTR